MLETSCRSSHKTGYILCSQALAVLFTHHSQGFLFPMALQPLAHYLKESKKFSLLKLKINYQYPRTSDVHSSK